MVRERVPPRILNHSLPRRFGEMLARFTQAIPLVQVLLVRCSTLDAVGLARPRVLALLVHIKGRPHLVWQLGDAMRQRNMGT